MEIKEGVFGRGGKPRGATSAIVQQATNSMGLANGCSPAKGRETMETR